MRKARAHAGRAAFVVVLGLSNVGGPASVSLAAASEAVPQISPEDLQDALERGDLSPEEFKLLSVMVQERLRSDSLEMARLAERLALTSGAPPAGGRGSRGEIRYSAYAPLRGSGSSGQYLYIEPRVEGVSARVHAHRVHSTTWQVDVASLKTVAGRLEFECGSLDLTWSGGLVVGRFPRLIQPKASGWAGLWQPGQSRLQGGRTQLQAGSMEVELFASRVSDSVWQHRVAGARLRRRIAGFWLEPTMVSQRLAATTSSGAFSSSVWGLSVGTASRRTTFQASSAMTGGVVALQTRVAGKAAAARWECEYWTVPAGFRHPLLHAQGEHDREPVFYPELGAYIQSASTGESGGRLAVRSGGSQTYGRVVATLWREQPLRPASVQLGVSAQTGNRQRSLRVEYSHLAKPAEQFYSLRHDAGLLAQYQRVFAEVRGRVLRGEGLPSGTAGGRLAGGVRVHTAGLGHWEVRATWDSYDLSLASRQFVTLRVDQRLPFHRGELTFHLRWRSAYASRAAVLGLRVDSSVYL